MDITDKTMEDSNVYDLITTLCQNLLETNNSHPSSLQKKNINVIKKLRSKAYEILLGKTSKLSNEVKSKKSIDDPIIEILNHIFILKSKKQNFTQANELEKLIDKFNDQDLQANSTIFSVLIFLAELKNYTSDDLELNIFHYGKSNPELPETTQNGLTLFQTYPIESLIVPHKFEAMLRTGWNTSTSKKSDEISIIDRYCGSNRMESLCYPNAIKVDSRTSTCVSNFTTETHNMASYFSRPIMDSDEDKGLDPLRSQDYSLKLFSSWPSVEQQQIDIESSESIWNIQNESVCTESHGKASNSFDPWANIELDETPVSNHCTWETLGYRYPMKEPMFLTDTNNSMIHLARIQQLNISYLLNRKTINSVTLVEEVPIKDFLNDLQSLFLGIESPSFFHDKIVGFCMRKNITIASTSSQTLAAICRQALHLGNCYKSLSNLVSPNLQTRKLQKGGLIFKAMCNGIKELLLFYQAAILRISSQSRKSIGLLKLLNNVQPLAVLITEVARLCRCDKQSRSNLDEGTGILTFIYKEVTEITNPRIALVFYSILKTCCEVYFRFLEKWLFEGACDDEYGEFMIKMQPQYLRTLGRKFWTKSFSINSNSVPGFLDGLKDSLVQCGKTVRLLKICDPKNPLFNVSVTYKPELKVCLSVTMLRQQLLKCQDYERKGNQALGEIVTISSAINSEKLAEQKRAELVVRAQKNTLLRLKKEQEDIIKESLLKKKQLLQELKNQAIEAASLREEEKKKELLLDELFLQRIKEEEKKIQELQDKERTNLIHYYNDLYAEVETQTVRAEWRKKRMNLFEKRTEVLLETNEDNVKEVSIVVEQPLENIETIENPSTEDENSNIVREITTKTNETLLDDKIVQFDVVETSELPVNYVNKRNNERSTLQDFLRDETFKNTIKETYLVNRPNFLNFETMTDRQRNKMKVMSHDYNMTPNNNEVKMDYFQEKEENISNPRETIAELDECSDEKIRDTGQDEIQLSEETTETPMSCTTDNLVSRLSGTIETPMSCTTDHFNQSKSSTSNFQTCDDISPLDLVNNLQTTSNLMGIFSNDSSSSSTSTLTVADVEMIDNTSLQVYLEKSIIIPLQIQSRLVNKAIVKLFLTEHDMLSHMHSLRKYFFLLNGEFAKNLMDSLYTRLYEISVPIELFNSAALTNLFERAVINSFSKNHSHSELLSFSVIDVPTELHISDPHALSCLCLNYKISWPLNIIFDEVVMLQYSKVFKYLLTIGRVSWVLQEDFNIMKHEKKASISQQYQKLQLYRYSMTQFINALHTYITCSVLHASWEEFEKELKNCSTLDEIYLSHINYIKRILSRCMLNVRGEKIYTCLMNIFKVILKFHNRLRSQSWINRSKGDIHPNFKVLDQLYESFCELRTYLAYMIMKLATSGYQPHLMHFFNALNINHLYDLTVKNH